jgi:asparagine synthase (glutamine-hydrolysing)
MESILPKEIIYRPKKGFTPPLGSWLRNELKSEVYDTLFSQRAQPRGIFNTKYIKKLHSLHHKNIWAVSDLSHRIWSLFIFELWCRKYIDKI